ncbi:LysM peptidoglycan-binding domain-containing protein [Persicirhabdus sediminis]|uniref:LysM peptidoglycan-binding domain-containing protein n=1 Tax=Persicirhabdus sediminis TaxID=454144 RepID=A0A8J7MFI6_9BACT|nr:LysM peptidoglycan-binding domain-containing protein [Persicirhabdus sediminis]MBK1791825.1 LysM peptidoglycan-binding domain-containing protein [Persicirhabdus sediminis]
MKSLLIFPSIIAFAAFTSCTPTDNYDDNPYGAPAADAGGNPYGVPDDASQAPYQSLPGVADSAPQTSAPAPSPEPAAIASTHSVVPGDSLWALSRKYNTTVEAIQSANNLTTTTIRVGETLRIPAP